MITKSCKVIPPNLSRRSATISTVIFLKSSFVTENNVRTQDIPSYPTTYPSIIEQSWTNTLCRFIICSILIVTILYNFCM